MARLFYMQYNAFTGDRTTVLDPLTGEIVPLFNPRQQRWGEHFAWTAAGDYIIGQPAIGRATVAALGVQEQGDDA